MENQKKELAILNEKQKEFNKLINTINSYKGQFKRQEKEIRKQSKEIEKRDKILTDLEYFLKGISKHMKEEDFISSSIEYQNALVKLYELEEKYQIKEDKEMSKADEMFKELKFEKICNNKQVIQYKYTNYYNNYYDTDFLIEFDKNFKEIGFIIVQDTKFLNMKYLEVLIWI